MTTVLRYSDGTLRALLVPLFVLAGAMKLTAHPFELHSFAHFGYATWFMYAIGLIEFGAAFALLRAELIQPAMALLAAVLVGAIASHVSVGDPILAAAPAVIILAMLGGLAAAHWLRLTKSQAG